MFVDIPNPVVRRPAPLPDIGEEADTERIRLLEQEIDRLNCLLNEQRDHGERIDASIQILHDYLLIPAAQYRAKYGDTLDGVRVNGEGYESYMRAIIRKVHRESCNIPECRRG